MPGAGAQVPVQAAGSTVADLDRAGLACLAADGDLPLPQVDITALRVVRVVPDARQLRQPDPGRGEHRDHRGVAALLERPAPAGTLQPGQSPSAKTGTGLFRTRGGRAPATPSPAA